MCISVDTSTYISAPNINVTSLSIKLSIEKEKEKKKKKKKKKKKIKIYKQINLLLRHPNLLDL
jgi:uncharacterized OsmC-like protein